MPRVAPPIDLDRKAKDAIVSILRSGRTRPRLKLRCRIVLLSSKKLLNRDIARMLGVPQVTVGKWRRAFAQRGIRGLNDAPRPGRPPKYDAAFSRRIALELKRTEKPSLRALARKLGVPPSTLHDLVCGLGLASGGRARAGAVIR